ncbi:MAG: patatin-like phospholipase family protein, partial [Bacteroidales bacterium]|nr:patatin-like phospholipase family protein [Bacteroidales bacterium]
MMKTLLAIDGGGLFGIGVANWIPKLENYKFDYYAGTSVGSILAASYAIGMAAEEVQEEFNGTFPKEIFKKPGL